MQHSETVGDALEGLVSNLSAQDRAVVASLAVSDGMALLTYAVYQPQMESAEQVTDAALAVTGNVLRALCGFDWHPAEVLVSRITPADPEPYRRHFKAPVRFNQESATLVFPVEDLKRRVAGADALLRTILEVRLRQLRADADAGLSDDIRRLLRIRLTSRRCSADDIADLLAMHRRTLSLRLKGSGMGYRAITNEIRFEIARQLLEDTEVPFGETKPDRGNSSSSVDGRLAAWRGAAILPACPTTSFNDLLPFRSR
jgi:AraC-like DNA-binding protein